MAKLPTFAVGSASKIQPAIDSGVLTNPAFVITTDTHQLVFIGEDNEWFFVENGTDASVLKVGILPDPASASENTLYICGKTVYSFDGQNFIPTYQDVTDQLSELSERISQLNVRVTNLEQQSTSLSWSEIVVLDNK